MSEKKKWKKKKDVAAPGCGGGESLLQMWWFEYAWPREWYLLKEVYHYGGGL